jgi:Zn-dependent M28 family amino/carboxypeptidase
MAVLRGSDPSVRDEVLVYTAHLDHLGVGEPLNGDRIYNGAYDNASGCAVLIEVARAFAGLPRSPRRSIMFMAVTGEEKGLQGSEYFTEYPTIPMENIIGNINLDMFLMLHPLNDLIAFGAEHSDLSGNVEDAARKLGIKTTPDPMPEEVIFVRSDQYNFVKKGVPAVFLVGGEDVGGVLPPGSVDDETWIRDYYHTQIDDMSQYIDFGAGVKFSQANLLIGYDVANQENRPKWNDGDFFGEKFGKLLGTPE